MDMIQTAKMGANFGQNFQRRVINISNINVVCGGVIYQKQQHPMEGINILTTLPYSYYKLFKHWTIFNTI